MNNFNVTQSPFITTSRENWMMLKRLDKDNTYEVIQAIADYILDGVEPSYEGLTGMVTEQVVSVITRKGQKSWNSKNNLGKANEAKAKKEAENKPIPTCDISSEEKLTAEEETPPQSNSQKPQQNDVCNEIFDTPEDLAKYLIQVKREKGKLAMEYKMNTLPRNNGFSWKEVYDIYKNIENTL